jgi:hypothetical protein
MKITLSNAELNQAILDSLPKGLVPENAEIRIVAGRGPNGAYAEIDTDLDPVAQDDPPFEPDPAPAEKEDPPAETAKTTEDSKEVSEDQPALFD